MWLKMKIFNKDKNFEYEPILFNTDEFTVIISDEKEENEFLNTNKINGDNNATPQMDKNNSKTSKEK